MVIKASSASDVRQLVDALGGADDVAREAAVARLAIIGPRAVDRLLSAFEAAGSPGTRVTVLRVLEAIADPRALPLASRALADGADVAIAAVMVLRSLLPTRGGSTGAEALDRLVAAALDRSADRRVRLAAFEALGDVPGKARDQVMEALAADADPAIRAHVADPPPGAAALDGIWESAVAGGLPDNPFDLQEALARRGPSAPLGVLQALIDLVRAREGSTGSAETRGAWHMLRGAVHQLLAQRGSRVAVYDLRETLEDANAPLPLSFLAALHTVGDDTCLEAIAGAWARARDAQWQHQLADVFRAIARRERKGPRSPVMKKILSRWPAAATLAAKPPTN